MSERETPLTYKVYIYATVDDVMGPVAVRNSIFPGLPEIYESAPTEGRASVKTMTYESGKWEGFVMPARGEDMTVVLFPGAGVPACEEYGKRGGALNSRVGVAIMPDDDPETILLRIRHELLHTMRLPADHLHRFHPAFFSRTERVRDWFSNLLNPTSRNRINWRQERYYSWLEQLWLDGVLGQMPQNYE